MQRGVEGHSPLAELKYFHFCDGFVVDNMHNILLRVTKTYFVDLIVESSLCLLDKRETACFIRTVLPIFWTDQQLNERSVSGVQCPTDSGNEKKPACTQEHEDEAVRRIFAPRSFARSWRFRTYKVPEYHPYGRVDYQREGIRVTVRDSGLYKLTRTQDKLDAEKAAENDMTT